MAFSETFIRANTRLIAPPLVPEVRLYLAEECLPLWQAAEDALQKGYIPPPFWAFAWAGGQALARYVLDNPEMVTDKRVLDLGTGSGLAAIAAMQAGAQSAVAADIDSLALAAVARNAEANGVAISPLCADLLDDEPKGFDVLLLGDLFYERPLAERALAYASRAASAGLQVLAGDPNRTYFPTARFSRLAEYRVPVSRDLEDCIEKLTGVWELPTTHGLRATVS